MSSYIITTNVNLSRRSAHEFGDISGRPYSSVALYMRVMREVSGSISLKNRTGKKIKTRQQIREKGQSVGKISQDDKKEGKDVV